jgi:nucleoside-diphosphate-sugar epimerase
MKKILIIGVNGFIGSSLLKELSKKHQVFGASRANSNNIDNWYFLDLTDKSAVTSFFKQHKFDVIIQLAAIMANKANLNDLDTVKENLNIYINLAGALGEYQGTHFINFSSSAVYPNITGIFKETDEVNPSVNADRLYGLSKFTGEMVLKSALPGHISQLHLRVGFVYGKGMNTSRIHPMFKAELLSDNHITVFGNGVRTIPQIEIKSLCQKIDYFIENGITGTFNTADENISLKSLAERTILKYGNKESTIVYRAEGNVQEFKLDYGKLNKLFNV